MLRYYLRIENPDAMSDEEWATNVVALEKIRETEKNSSVGDVMKLFS